MLFESENNACTIIDILCEFIEIAVHTILYVRKQYPETIFERKRKYGAPVHCSIHPALNEYISNCINTVRYHLKTNQLRNVSLCFNSGETVVERYNFEIIDVNSCLESDPFLVKLEQYFRDFCLKLHEAANNFGPLPDSSTFSVQLQVTEYSKLEFSQDFAHEIELISRLKMCDVGNKNRRGRQNSLVETSKTVKGIFKKDDLDDSLSTSDWGLLIEEGYRSRQRNRSVKLGEEPLTLICDWGGCYQAFSEYVPYHEHLKLHLEEEIVELNGTVECCWSECTFSSQSFSELAQHACFHAYHAKLKSVGKNVENRAKLPQCTQTEHFQVPASPGGYQCEWEYCHERFNTLFEFFGHVRVHVYHNAKGCKEGVINCCWKGCTSRANFASQYKLAEHLRIHTKEKIIACPTCGNLFANKTKFCDHRRRQLPMNQQSYLCSQCSKYFPSERLLRDHMRLHINQYKCSMCDMTCPKPSILAKHIRYRHLKEKPFKCNQCNYECVSKHNLDFHVKKHDPDSQYKCSDCGYTCRSSFGLERHYQRSHGKGLNNKYECHNCKKQFIRGGHLTKHLMKVHNYHWPSGHSRFRYKEDPDGIYRLQTVRYETLNVTEEIIKGKTIQAPPAEESLRFRVSKRKRDENSVEVFDIDFDDGTDYSEPSEPEDGKKVVITIDDIDLKGNVVKSQTIQSSEVICSDIPDTSTSDNIVIVKSKSSKKRKK